MTLPDFDAEATDPAQCAMLYAFVLALKPRVCVEAGTYKGHGAVWIAEALAANGSGDLWTADPYDFGQEQTLKPYPNIHYRRQDFLDMLAEFDTVDFAYIDASEWGPSGRDASLRVRHFEAVRPKMSPGGLILVDDTASDDWTDGEGGKSVLRIREHCMNFRFLRGLSVYQAP